MKLIAATLAGFVFTQATFGQGQFIFNNHDPSLGIDARFVAFTSTGDIDPPGTSSLGGSDWIVQIIPMSGGPASPASTVFLGAPGTSGAGYVVPVTVTVANVPPGQTVDVALIPTRPKDLYTYALWPFHVTLGSAATSIPTLDLGNQPLLVDLAFVPEPSTAYLISIGALFLLICSRRAWRYPPVQSNG